MILALEGVVGDSLAGVAWWQGGCEAEGGCHLLEGHTWILWYWCVLLMTFSAQMLKQ